jgi:hypothetical protein
MANISHLASLFIAKRRKEKREGGREREREREEGVSAKTPYGMKKWLSETFEETDQLQ